MPHAKIGPDPLRSMAVHPEQRNIHTDAHTEITFMQEHDTFPS